MYLLKYLAHCGLCSRRKAVDLIKKGFIKVNGKTICMPFALVNEHDIVLYNDRLVTPEPFVYILLNKPKNVLTTCFDERGRKTVLDLIAGATRLRVYPVGRLDRMSTGLLLITNDGLLAQKLSHPSSKVEKQYQVYLDKAFSKNDLKRLTDGFELEDGIIRVDDCFYGDSTDKKDVVVQIHSGRNRIVRRMFLHLGYRVEKLDRIRYAGLKKHQLARSSWRFLTSQELEILRG